MTITEAPQHTAAPAPTRYASVGFGNVLRSEWTKLRSVRSTYLCGAMLFVAMVGLGIFMGARWAHESGALPDDFDPTNVTLSGAYIGQIILGALGVLAISSEYATGMIRASLTAVPQRRSVLAAKAIVLATVTVVVGEILAFTSFGIGQALLHGKHAGASLGDPGVLRAVAGTGLYLTVSALLGFGLGAAIRHTAGAISALFGLVFATNAIIDLLPTSWRNDIINYLPLNAGSQILTIVQTKGGLAPWTGLGVYALYALAALVAGFLLIDARDA
jgi:ABC-2 type transport system permease protein